MSTSLLQQTDRLFHLDTPLGEDVLLVKRISGTEQISELFHYELDLVSDNFDIDFDQLVGKPITVGIRQSDGSTFHYINGIVSKFALYSDEGRLACYQAEVVPWLWLLTQATNCTIYQNLEALAAIKQVFQQYGFQSGHDWEDQTTLKRSPWVYCTQYRESACNFVKRLMELEGIFFFFRHEQDRHVLVMGDTPSAHKPCPYQSRIKFEHSFGTGYKSDEDSILAWRFHNQFKPGKYKQRAYNFMQPTRTLEAVAPSRIQQGGNSNYEVYDYPGLYEIQADGDEWTKMRIEEEEATHSIATGMSNCRSLYAGFRFDLYNHDRRDQNVTWLVTSVSHSGEEATFIGNTDKGGGTYYNTFTAIPYSVPFRPQRKFRNSQSSGSSPSTWSSASPLAPPSPGAAAAAAAAAAGAANAATGFSSGGSSSAGSSPLGSMSAGSGYGTERTEIRGVTTAMVVGTGGDDEIYTEEYSRVQVKFHWDCNDQGRSCWARVMQPWAGQHWGHIWIPRVGQEVVVAFQEGDPDYPIVIGMVYNADNMPPYKLPDKKNHSGIRTHSTTGGGADNYNEIHFDDTKGSELFSVQAEYNKAKLVKNNELEEIRNDRYLRVVNDQVEDVQNDKKQHVKGDHNEGVDGDISIKVQGDYQLVVGGDYTKKVTGDLTRVVQGDVNLTVSGEGQIQITGDVHLTVTGDLHIKAANIFVEADEELCLSCGGSSIDMDPMSLSITAPSVLINSGGASTPAEPASPDNPDFPDPDLGTVPKLSDMGDFGGPGGDASPDNDSSSSGSGSGSGSSSGGDSGPGSGGAGGDGGSGSDSFLGGGDDDASDDTLGGI
jgi:type VI secretion system secreted protein VgrG